MLDPSSYDDDFARANLPPEELWPVLDPAALATLGYARRINAAVELLDRHVEAGFGARACIRARGVLWSYATLLEKANRIANVLVHDMDLVSGNRVLLRAANTPLLAACWFAVLKAGGIVVATMPLLRARELGHIIDKAQVRLALCDASIAPELETALSQATSCRACYFNTDAGDGLEARMTRHDDDFPNHIASHDDVALIAFTSGTTGPAKATMHFHRDVLAVCDAYPAAILQPSPDDVFAASPPLAFTYGLGAVLLFPMRFGASSVLLERATPETLLQAVQDHRVTTSFTGPTLYRAMTPHAGRFDLSSLHTCVSAGEHLPIAVFEAWRRATGLSILDSMGSTELLHAVMGIRRDSVRPGATGQALPLYDVRVFDDDMRPVAPGTVGRLAVRGPTGCRYLDDVERQKNYVRDGWNLTGDAFSIDRDGFLWYHARTDDMIVSAGYNISGAEIEEALLEHKLVKECAVVGVPDPARGQIVKAFVVPHDPAMAGDTFAAELQDFVKASIAPYKYPRAVEFLEDLPRTGTGKVQRRTLRERG